MKALLIPIYEPTERVVTFLKQFERADFDAFLVVDDGSGEDYASIFENIAEQTCFSVVGYPVNHGKGHALKHGLNKLLEDHPDLDFVVTADGDGQHLREDILRVVAKAEEGGRAIVLGCRDFRDAPPKSASGNLWSARYFRLASGVKITDCQTGLRAIPRPAFELFLHTYGARFDYEMNFLLVAAREFGLSEVTIATIYEDGNKGTHFRPVKDSLLIMRTPISYLIAAVLSFLTEFALFSYLCSTSLLGDPSDVLSVFAAFGIARGVSLPFNYFMLKFLVFHHKKRFHWSLPLYLLAALGNFLIMSGAHCLNAAATMDFSFLVYLLGFVLGVFSYFLHSSLTFANRKLGKE